ncbi:phospholipase A2 inhibitor and Ly6/PLAUR domain-containing protein [Ornithorhynchus anatinus]|uniref:phospholipase A2 inhibitor and Ly6/PLAUR domain-containing protein n=1 Tax=Ornithorhynchus anatinus TaxID=9258 RepID=UPI0010A8A196|nr:phospholipase A2 inhibitor and Ly6/PLAUR domain-containing protein [Ornithorhynchus anatinus]
MPAPLLLSRSPRPPGPVLLSLLALCLLLSPGHPLSCEVCKGSGPSCSGKLKTCEGGKDGCVVIVGETVTGGRKSLDTFKSCVKFSDCHSGFISTTMGPRDYLVSNARCCQNDGCNRGTLSAPTNNRTENGLRCPGCMVPFQDSCPGKEMARCVGLETHCIYFSGTVQAGIINTKFASRGCATESACQVRESVDVPSATYTYRLKRADCEPAPRPPGRAEK